MLQAFPHQRFGAVKGEIKTISSTILAPAIFDPRREDPRAGVPGARAPVEHENPRLWRAYPAAARHAAVGRIVFDRRSLISGCSIPSSPWRNADEPPDNSTSRAAAKLPLVLASEAAECGLACMAMVARFHGHDVDLNGLRQRFALSLVGHVAAQPHGARRPAWAFDPRAAGRARALSQGRRRRPSCTGTSIISSCCVRSAATRSIVIHDPALGVRTLPLAEVSKHFTGVVLELTPTARFPPVDARGAGPAVEPVVADDRLRERLRAGDRAVRCCRSPPSPRRFRSSSWSTRRSFTPTRIS